MNRKDLSEDIRAHDALKLGILIGLILLATALWLLGTP
jgi:hypothetical protein